ncbi:MAG: carboxypeptidase-like regulatory domain-containing protein [Bacteroidetes bacterium]|nr:MAG: carboxypeptidase-like regulatory domain-containing protein [Bacteroidota bacterium]
MPRNCFLFLLLLFSQILHGQYFTVSGIITNNKLEPLPLVSVKIKDMPGGTVSHEDGKYELKLEEGKYDLIFSSIGYKAQIITLVVTGNYVQNIILESDDGKDLSEVIVRGKIKDRGEEMIRNVIRNKEQVMAASGTYSYNAYIKATQIDSSIRKIKKKKSDSVEKKNDVGDLAYMSMAEVSLRVDKGSDTKIKEERSGVVKRGRPESLFFLSTTEGDFNIYNNLLRSRVLSQVPFLSPVSYGGLAAYRYKIVNTRLQGKNKIYTISIKPRQLSNVTVEGEVVVMDSAWVVLSAHYKLPAYHLPEYDFFEIDQQYSFVDNKAWMITRQQFTYYSKTGRGKLSGQTIANYSDFELNKTFPPKYFGVELSSTTQQAYERDSSFWQKVRTEPLSEKEVRFIQYKDSLYRATHTKAYLDSIDRAINKITWKKVAFTGITFYNREKERTLVLPAAASLVQFIQFGGARLSANVWYNKTYKSRKNIGIYTNLSYGFRNHDINGKVSVTRMYNPFNRGFYRVMLGRDFEYIFSGDAWINMIKRTNFYLNNAISLGHGLEIKNGLFLYTDLDLAFRESVSHYKTNSKVDSAFGQWLGTNQAIPFEPYNTVNTRIRLAFTPGQKYIREPKEKIILGSKWPTFYVEWKKGIPVLFNSTTDFDYLEFGIEQELKLGTTGVSKYKVITGDFLNTKGLELVDYKFQRRDDPIFFMNPHEAFQSLDSTFPVFNRFYQGHYVHEFNGAFLNKVPLFKKLQLREIAGAGFLVAPERDLRYFEMFAGVERVFKWPFNPTYKFKIGVYIIGSAANKYNSPVQFKIGFASWDKSRNRWM